MRLYFLLIIVLLTYEKVFSQNNQQFVFDTIHNDIKNGYVNYYGKTNFSFVDTLELWNYQLDMTYRGFENDSIKPLGQLILWRTKPIHNKVNVKVYGELWTPYITFDVYNLSDSLYCYKSARAIRLISSCTPPNVGGDVIIIGSFIFVDKNVCLHCQGDSSKPDYCRPVVNKIFLSLKKRKINSLESIEHAFPIKKGQRPK